MASQPSPSLRSSPRASLDTRKGEPESPQPGPRRLLESSRPGRGAPSPLQLFDPTSAGERVAEVPLEDIDVADETFRYRLEDDPSRLCPSLQRLGQLEPVALVGNAPPYRIVDGFDRVRALALIGARSVRAILLEADEEQAHARAWLANVQRRRFTPVERALWVARALQRGRTVEQTALDLNLSARQVQRYRALAEVPEAITALVEEGLVSMAHAFVLKRWQQSHPDLNLRSWANRCNEAGWSAQRLAIELGSQLRRSSAEGARVRLERGKVRVVGFEIGVECSAEALRGLMARLQQEVEECLRAGHRPSEEVAAERSPEAGGDTMSPPSETMEAAPSTLSAVAARPSTATMPGSNPIGARPDLAARGRGDTVSPLRAGRREPPTPERHSLRPGQAALPTQRMPPARSGHAYQRVRQPVPDGPDSIEATPVGPTRDMLTTSPGSRVPGQRSALPASLSCRLGV